MRDILFRGKRVDDGQWVEGDLVHRYDFSGNLEYEYENAHIKPIGKNELEVIPEIVGQFIGILDKNGKKIFEGDILKCISPNNGSEFISDFIATLANGITFKNSDLNWDMILFEYEWMEVEIIGNIHDSPELLCK